MILNTLADAARERMVRDKEKIPFEEMRALALDMKKGDFCFKNALCGDEIAFICEVKKASPSKGVIAEKFPYLDIAQDYERAGASAISVLTETDYFLGSDEYLTKIRSCVGIPIIRKDFTIDPYQIYQAKVIGADAVLLICALLDTKTIENYLKICNDLGLCAIVEAHTEPEVKSAISAGAEIIGVNNRDLKTFNVDITNCVRLREIVPSDKVFVAESGIKTPEDIDRLRKAGVDAVLIGETLMRCADKKHALDSLKGGSH